MKLYEIVQTILHIADAQPSVNYSYEGDVYLLNELKDIHYGVCVLTQGQHRQEGDFIYYDFYIYYIDRLTDTGDNRLHIQSTGMDTVSSIIKGMGEKGFDFDNIIYQVFTQRFEAECAGVYAQVSFIAPEDDCFEEWEEEENE